MIDSAQGCSVVYKATRVGCACYSPPIPGPWDEHDDTLRSSSDLMRTDSDISLKTSPWLYRAWREWQNEVYGGCPL